MFWPRAHGGRVLRHAEDVLSGPAEVGAADHAAVAGAAAGARVPEPTLPLDAELGRLVARHLDDQGFDEDLRAAHVELVDHGAQLAIDRVGRGDDERVGRRVRLDVRASDLSRYRRRGRGRSRRTARRGLSERSRARGPRLGLRSEGLGSRRQTSGLVIAPPDAEQRARKPRRLCVFQVHDVDVARRGRRLVELGDQGADEVRARRARRADEERIAARLGENRHPLAGVPAGRRIEHAPEQDRDVARDRVLQPDDVDVGARGRVDRGDDARDAAHVLGVIGDDDGVVRRIGVDGVVRRDQRAQHRHHVRRRFVVEAKHLRDQLVPARPARGAPRLHRSALELGVGLGDHADDAARFDQAVALQAQRRGQRRHRLVGRERLVDREVQRAFDARIDDEGFARELGDRAHHRVDFGIGEIERDALLGRRGRA